MDGGKTAVHTWWKLNTTDQRLDIPKGRRVFIWNIELTNNLVMRGKNSHFILRRLEEGACLPSVAVKIACETGWRLSGVTGPRGLEGRCSYIRGIEYT